MDTQATILIVKGESDDADQVRQMLGEKHQVIGPEDPDDALARVNDSVSLVISEVQSSKFDGLELLRAWKDRQERTPFLAIAETGDVAAAVEAMKLGAADCLVKPLNEEKLLSAVNRLIHGPSGGDDQVWPPETQDRGGKTQIDIPPGTSLEDLERAAVEQALAQHHGNRTHAAKTLGISVRTLQRKLKAWGMPLQTASHRTSNGFLLPTHHTNASPAAFTHAQHAH